MTQNSPDEQKLLGAIQGLHGRTKAAQLRRLMPEIDQRVREGIQHQEIIDSLNDQGFDLNLNTFRSYLYRYRKKQREQGGTETASTTDGNQIDSAPKDQLEKPDAETKEKAVTAEPEPESDKSEDDDMDLDRVLASRNMDSYTDGYINSKRKLFKGKE